MIPIQRHYANRQSITFLWRANFDTFNRAYMPLQDGCASCCAASGFDSTELQGDEHMTGWVHFFTPCPDCLGAELCPGCLSPLVLSFDQSAFGSDQPPLAAVRIQYYPYSYIPNRFDYEIALSMLPFEGFTCLVCGWQYDPDRFADQYDEPYDDGDYPMLDASDWFGGI